MVILPISVAIIGAGIQVIYAQHSRVTTVVGIIGEVVAQLAVVRIVDVTAVHARLILKQPSSGKLAAGLFA